jgi:polyhydroxybutyrate depolymerase
MSVASMKAIAGGFAALGLGFATACATQFKSAPDAGMSAVTGTGPTTTTTAGTSGATPGTTAGSGVAVTPVATAGSGPVTSGGASGAGAPVAMTGAAGTGLAAAGSGAGGSNMTTGSAGTTEPTTGTAGAAGTTTGSAGSTAAPVTCPGTKLAAGDSNGSVQVGSVTRNYILHIPANYTGTTPVPLVTDWHPILFNDSFEESVSNYKAKSEKEGFIVVWPDGIDNAWNVADCCTTSRTVDDVGFARALIAKLETQACIDPKRVYAVGYSMGGGMSYKLACDATDIIAAIAPAAFQLMTEAEWPCHPSRPITVISTNGTADNVIPYAGGDVRPPNGLNVTNHFLGAVGTLKAWAMKNGCTDAAPVDKGGGCQTYVQCQGGVETTLCTVQGGGHSPADPEVTWATLKRFTLP